jgi:Ca-activated chloride channel family protein
MKTPRRLRPSFPVLHLALLGLFGFLGLLPGPGARADGLIYVPEPGGPVPEIPGRPHVHIHRRHFPLAVARHHVRVEVDETLARTRVEETFHNPNDRQLEGTYLFPLPPEASVTAFSMKIGGQEIAGEILEKDKAREIYENIVRQVKDPGLLEYVERGLFRARVFPIPARGTVDVAVEYSESLTRSAGTTSYRYPLDTGKYSTGPYRDVLIDVRLRSSSPLCSLHSPSHDAVQVTRGGEREARVTLEAKELRADKDFLLNWNVSEDTLAPVVLAHRGAEAEGFFFLSMLPRPDVEKKVPKDLVFVIDTSRSMLGEKLEQVKRALRYSIHNLDAGDRFNLVDFSTEARRFREGLVEVSEESRSAAEAYIAELKARGGTNIEEGMRLGLRALGDPARLGMLVLLTDGEPTIGVTAPDDILKSVDKENTAKRRVFVFGVGDDLNAKLLDAVARASRGVTEYVRQGSDVEVPLARFYDKIDSPVFTDIRLEVAGGGVEDLYPRPLPDLFRGDQLDVFGRYREDGTKTLLVRGKYQGEEKVFEYSLAFAGAGNGYLPRLWAMRKVGYLLEQMRLHGETKELKDEVIHLSKRYGVITPYTSYLILEEDRLAVRPPGVAPGAPGVFRYAASDALGGSPAVTESAVEARDAFSRAAGKEAVAASRRLGELKAGRADEELERYVEDGVNADGVRVRHVEGYTFYRQGERWIDAALTGRDLEEIADLRRVRYLSEEYFALLREEPGIGRLLALGAEVSFLWKGKVVSVEA